MIVKVETDKAVADLPCPVSGTILKINYSKGDTVNVGAVLCVIGESGEKLSLTNAENRKKDLGVERIERKETKVENVEGKILASPAVRKAAQEKGIDLSKVSGSGPDGQIVMSDLDKSGFTEVTKIVETARPAGITAVRKYDMFGYVERVPLKGVRKVIAQNMISSLSKTAQVTAMEDIDVSKLGDLRKREKEHFALEGVKLTFMPFVIKAVVKALTTHPKLNSSLEGESIVMKKYYN